jgi:hypothetical protein
MDAATLVIQEVTLAGGGLSQPKPMFETNDVLSFKLLRP